MKKYLFLIPTLFVMLLNVLGCGQVVYAADTDVDYSVYFNYGVEEVNELCGFDFTDFDDILSVESQKISPELPYYFYCISADKAQYDKFINGNESVKSNLFRFEIIQLSEADLSSIIENDYYWEFSHLISYRHTYLSYNSSYPFVSYLWSSSSKYPYYYKNTGTFYFDSDSSRPLTDYTNKRIYFYQASNIPDFPFPDFVNHGGSSGKMKVDVQFEPALFGEVERLKTDLNGNTSLANRLRFTLINKSSFPIQYQLFIVRKSFDFDVTAPYDNSYVFMYYSNSWVYSPSIDDASSFNNQLPQKQNKSSSWHYVKANTVDTTLINYSQINLFEKNTYTVYVLATRCDYDAASECIISPVEDFYPEMKQVYRGEVVYQSDFSMVHYSDVKYDPKDSSNGVLPFSSYEDISKYHLSYNAKENQDGSIDYTAKDVYSDKNSWYHDPSSWSASDIGSSPGGSSSGSSYVVSSDFSSLSRSFGSFFGFVSSAFSYFPSSFKAIISLGLTSLVVLALIKAVFR